MPLPRKVVVLLHERDRHADVVPYVVWPMAAAWRKEGVEVELVRGADRFVDADVAFCHVDLTVVPEEYARLLARYPRAVNAGARDISKSRVSRHRVAPGDPWEGPVIVKTDANCGGLPEERILGRRLREGGILAALGRLLPRARREVSAWRRRWRIPSESYPVFPSVGALPPGVLENPELVVERFLPERDGDLYALRLYFFLGDREVSVRVRSKEPVVKSRSMIGREEVPLHPGAAAARDRLAMDYGKLDFVVRDGEAVVFDANRTPVFSARPDLLKSTAEALAPGLASFAAPAR
jgi:hypothetical protein